MKVERLQAKLTRITASVGVPLDDSTTSDLHQIMLEEEEQVAQKFPLGSFQHIFWQQQKVREREARDALAPTYDQVVFVSLPPVQPSI